MRITRTRSTGRGLLAGLVTVGLLVSLTACTSANDSDSTDGASAEVTAGTDGTDGPTDAAGGIVDGESARRARALGQDPRARLENNDANPMLDALGDLVTTGPTNTNLLDLYLLLVEPAGR